MSRHATRKVETQPEPQHTGFAAKLRQALAEDQLTVEDFSHRIDQTLRTVQRWRAGQTAPSVADLVLIARALNRDPAWFVSNDEQQAA